MMIPFDLIPIVSVFFIGGIATFFFVATGGVGLITTPSLILMGLSPQVAIATDLFAMFGGRLGGLLGLNQQERVDYRLGFRLSAIAIVGATSGAFLLLAIDENLMRKALGIFMLLILVFLIKRRDIGTRERTPSLLKLVFGHISFYLVGFWGALVGAGFVSLGNVSLLFLFNKTFLESAAILMLIGIAIGIVGLVVFGLHGVIDWQLGFSLLAGKSIGGYLGARFAIKLGDVWIRRGFIAIVLVGSLIMLLG